MAVRTEKTAAGEDIVIDGFETGIAPSPHKGIANIQNGNISTENGEVMASFARQQQTMTNTSATGSLTFADSSHVALSIANTNNLFKGNWITVAGSSNTSQLPNGVYYVPPSTGSNFQLSHFYNSYVPVPITVQAIGGGGGGGAVNVSGLHSGTGGGAGAYVKSTSVVELTSATIVVATGGSGTGAGGTGFKTGANGVTSTNFIGGGGGGSSAFIGAAGTTVIAAGGGGGTTADNGVDLGGLSATGTIGGAAFVGTGGGVGGAGGAGTNASGITPGTGATTATFVGGTAGSAVNGGGSGGAGAPGITGNGGSSSNANGTGTAGGTGSGGAAGGTNTGGAGGAGTNGDGGGGGGGASSGNGGAAGAPGAGGGGGGASSTSGGAGGNGIVIISYPTGAYTATGGTITTSGGNTIHTFTTSGTWTVTAVTAVPNSVPLTGFSAGLTASFTMLATMGIPVASTTETYYASGIIYHRYYVLDANNLVWVYDDQNEVTYSTTDNVSWFLPDFQTAWCIKASGIGVISGFLVGATEHGLFGKSVVTLGGTNTTNTTWVQFPDITAWNGSGRSATVKHFCYVGHQGVIYITDGSYIVSVLPISTIAAVGVSGGNIQSFGSWTNDPIDNVTADFSIISGTTPQPTDNKRVPAVFFTVNGGTMPTALTAGTVYYIAPPALTTFQVFTAASGGSSLDIRTGASGPQYYNTFYPIASASATNGATPLSVLSGQRLTLPGFETAQCMAEIGNNVLIGCAGNVVYPWDQISNIPSGIIPLPESNVTSILTVNQMCYIFTGNKANIYITDGSQASQVLSVPDYAAGVPGSPATYIEPQFIWGGVAYVRGRVYFSVLDQTATKAGNCGGIWSFIPTQNLYIGQDTGIALRLENQNSYGTYNGYAPLLIARQNQVSGPPLYWSPWQSSVSSPTYGIDYTSLSTNASLVTIIETDAIPTGTMLEKKTFKQMEFKLSSPLDTGATVTMFYRKDLTSAWKSCGSVNIQANRLSGYFPSVFEKTQWLQIRCILTPVTSTTNSFVRLNEIRIR